MSIIYEVRRYEDTNKRICVVKRAIGGGRTEVHVEGAADLSSLGIDQPIAYSVPLAVPNQDNLELTTLVAKAFELYDDRTQKAVQDMYEEYKVFKEATEKRLQVAAASNAAGKLLQP